MDRDNGGTTTKPSPDDGHGGRDQGIAAVVHGKNNNNAKEYDDDALAFEGIEEEDDKKRFEWELEFVQCLASPAYLHFLATYRDDDDDLDDDNDDDEKMEDVNAGSATKKSKSTKKKKSKKTTGTVLLQDPHFQAYLRYLRDTWSQPEYAVYLMYPHCLYFLNLLVDNPAVLAREWAQPAYRNFCHHQQFLAWQHRHSTLYGHGLVVQEASSTNPAATEEETLKDGP